MCKPSPEKTLAVLLALVAAGLCLAVSLCRAQTTGARDYIIGPDDVLEIKIWQNEDLNRTLEVSKEGAITFPLIGKVQAAGLSLFDLEKQIKKMLGAGFLKDPQVSVSVSEYRGQKVYVLGEVKRPGSVAIRGRTHLLDAISEAGGLTENAGRRVILLRSRPRDSGVLSRAVAGTAGQEEVEADLTDLQAMSTMTLSGGESVWVSRVSRVYVVGEVNKPGEVKWEEGLTVNQAVSLAGGPTRRGAPNRAKIIRMQNGNETELKANMGDPAMPDDIIKIPQSYF